MWLVQDSSENLDDAVHLGGSEVAQEVHVPSFTPVGLYQCLGHKQMLKPEQMARLM